VVSALHSSSCELFFFLTTPVFSAAAPRVAGLLVKLLAWVLEMPVIGWIVISVLKRDNLVYKVLLCYEWFLCFTDLKLSQICLASSLQLVSDADIPEPPLFTATHTWRGHLLVLTSDHATLTCVHPAGTFHSLCCSLKPLRECRTMQTSRSRMSD
jgi:hypothetical protein